MNSKVVRFAPFLIEFFEACAGLKKGGAGMLNRHRLSPHRLSLGGLLSSRARVCFAG
jgi:hypothetical protein